MKELVTKVINRIKFNVEFNTKFSIKSIIRRTAVEMLRGICLGLLFSLASCAATQAGGILGGEADDVLNISGSVTSYNTKDISDMTDSELCLTIIGNWSETSQDLINKNLILTEENIKLKIGQPIAVHVPEDIC